MKRGGFAILFAVVVVACGPSGRLFYTTVMDPDGASPQPVTLGDQTNLVVGIEAGPTDRFPDVEPSVLADPVDSNAIIVTWLGGACETETIVVLHGDSAGYDMAVSPKRALFGSCPAVGILRAIRIRTSERIPIELITMVGAS